jgi:hypothetical protein
VHPKLKLEQGESMPAETGDSTVMKYQLRLWGGGLHFLGRIWAFRKPPSTFKVYARYGQGIYLQPTI